MGECFPMEKKRISLTLSIEEIEKVLKGKSDYIRTNLVDISMNEFLKQMIMKGISEQIEVKQ